MVKNIIGQKFGRLTVIKRDQNDGRRRAQWLCKCECGNEEIIDGASLRTGHTKSCGCLNKEIIGSLKRLPPGLSNMRSAISRYKRNAKRRGLKYDLTEEQFKEITQRNCHYCGAKPNNITTGYKLNGSYIYNGIDRIDNNKGYTIDNIVPCCKTCNAAKGILTTWEFKDWILDIYNTTIKKKGEVK